MALLDIDRHILSEIAEYQRKLTINKDSFYKEWHKVIEVRDKTDALLFTHPECKNLTEECSFRQIELKKLRNQIFRASDKASTFLQESNSLHSKQEALLTHLVSLVKSIDTGKGLESDDTRHKEAEGED